MLKIFGHSDDTVCIEGDFDDEFDAASADVAIIVGDKNPRYADDSAGVVVRMEYLLGGVWGATIQQIDSSSQIPWPVSVSSEKYSVVVTIECPDGTPVQARIDDELIWENGEWLDDGEGDEDDEENEEQYPD